MENTEKIFQFCTLTTLIERKSETRVLVQHHILVLSFFFFAEYNRIIIFKEPVYEKVLPGHVIRTEKVKNEGSCRVKCYLEPNCVSINVGPEVEGTRTCELKNYTDESSAQSDLEERKHHVHFAVEVQYILSS